ncbi:MAG TPA: hypothetical protein VGI65_13305 [Steroidobacteraceae bacterium]
MARKHELPATTLNGGTIGFLTVGRAVTILHVGWMDNHPNPLADGVGEDMPLTALDQSFPAALPRGPPDTVVLTDWLSITPAVGLTFPARGLAQVHQQHMIVCHTPCLAMHRSSAAPSYMAAQMPLRPD